MTQQQFQGQVGQVAAGDIKNFIEVPQAEIALLSSAQRQALNVLVTEISSECEVEARALWREVVHVSVGVQTIAEIPRDRFHDAESALLCWRDEHRRQANLRLLVARITTLTKAHNLYSERDSWCLRQFGEKQLNAMDQDHLRQVLAWVEDHVSAAKAPRLNWLAQAYALWKQHPTHMAAMLLAGVTLGIILW